MNIKQTFLELTSKTYPYGFEDELVKFLPRGYFQDTHGNYYFKIGVSKTAFTCHLDTACKDQVDVIHKIEGNIISTDGKSILGADDKAGVTILLYMIEKGVPGLYCFFIGEECGCIGSGFASKDPEWKNYNRMISFDRRGTTSVITHQSYKRCCSDQFAGELASELNRSGLNMKADDTGVYTDSAEFTDVIPECTNISVGYYKEHTFAENQDIQHLSQLCNAVIKVDWENLSTKRDPKLTEWGSYNRTPKTYSRYDGEVWGNDYTSSWGNRSYPRQKRRRNYDRRSWNDHDDWYSSNSSNSVASTKNGRVFFNDLENDITETYYSTSENKNHYQAIKEIIYNDHFSKEDLEKLKDQYLDMEDPQDRDFYDEITSLI